MPDRWTAAQLPDLDGRTVVVTGANSGIGLVTARELARVGAHVVLAVRDEDRGRAAAASIDGIVRGAPAGPRRPRSVRAFADGWTGDLDVLVNNAGVMAVPEQRTVDGFELQFATNHLGHFALTNLLLPSIIDRVVTVSSRAHRMGRIVLDDLNWERRHYWAWPAYGQSKLANLLFTLELERRLTAAGSAVRAAGRPPRLRGHEPPVPLGEPDHVGDDGGRQPGRRPERRAGRAAHAVRRHAGPARLQLRRTRRLPGDPRPPDARDPQRGGRRSGRWPRRCGRRRRSSPARRSRRPTLR